MKSDDSKRSERLEVAVVSTNPETLDGLHTYLKNADVNVHRRRTLDVAFAEAHAGYRAVVLFPDDYPRDHVLRALRNLRDRQPNIQAVLVTRLPKQFQEHAEDGPKSLVIVTKPAWGWTILDAIHGRAGEDLPKRALNS